MPRTEINYNNTIIYKIVSKDVTITKCYVGSTTDFTRRKSEHKSHCNNTNSKNYNYFVYEFIRDNGGWSNWNMIMIETYNCNTKLECLARERYWIEQLKAELNSLIPSRTQQEYQQQNKDKIDKYHQQYYQQNKIKIAEYHIQRYPQNKDKLIEYQHQYRIQNKDKINQKVDCNCGGKFTQAHKAQHLKTKLHQTYINNNT
jgi:hypothetical protein